ncbi:hypothetical protein ACFV2X_10985 [Streptomyces sp. NPDC059679]|uniref:hypothetical protein n=1 Tax=Streptomyces sp. NPDC059679 TaxID=3346903 RepID=UPI003688E5A4
MNEAAWEGRHISMYGCGSWARAVKQASLVYEWRLEHGLGLDAQAMINHLAQHPEAEGEWVADRKLLGLVLWRTAWEHGVLLDEVIMADGVRYCTPSGAADLFRDPLPELAAHLPPKVVVGWESRLKEILLEHAAVDLATCHSTRPQRRLGYRVRELRATSGWVRGDWPTAVDLAHSAIEKADQARRGSRWQVGPIELDVAARVGLNSAPMYDYPPTPANPDHPTWLQRAHRLTDLATTLHAVSNLLPRDHGGFITPLGMVFDTCAGVFAALRESAEEIERLWAAERDEPADLDYWDLAHVPEPVEQQTAAAEQLVQTLGMYLRGLALKD